MIVPRSVVPESRVTFGLGILVPAYNESDRITPMLRDYCEHFAGRAAVTVVANACTDDTVGVVESLMQQYSNLRLIVVNGRIGKGGAIRAGFKVAREPYLGFADADGSTDAAEFDRLFQECLKRKTDGVIGSRWLPGADVIPAQPRMRRLASRTFNGIVRVLFGLSFSDTQCGAKIFRREAIEAVLPALEIADFAFDIDLLYRMKTSGFHIEEVPTRWADRAAGTKVRIGATSLCMLKATLRLRLHESWFWRLPFAELIARESIIPVKEATSILALGDDNADAWTLSCLEVLEQQGCQVERSSQIRRGRWPLLLWYVFASRRRYDAIIEVASNAPALVPVLSSKRCFLLGLDAKVRSFPRVLYAMLYGRAHRITAGVTHPVVYSSLYGVQPLTNSLPEAAARYIIDQIGVGHLYKAAFHRGKNGWELRFSDIESGSCVFQDLV